MNDETYSVDGAVATSPAQTLVDGARTAWAIKDPSTKCEAVTRLAKLVDQVSSTIAIESSPPMQRLCRSDTFATCLDQLEPGRPSRPRLVHPSKVARRQTGRAGGRAVLLHAIAHIEFNAINLALDAAWRYPNMPVEFARDWVSVAIDEVRHFQMLCDELNKESIEYGDFDAHDGLWAMARRTAADLTARMALVPRVLEARGLDATPVIQQKLKAAGDDVAVALLQVLLDEEVSHVRIGDGWFRRLCLSHGEQPEARYQQLINEFDAPTPKLPLNTEARLKAGFSQSELDWLTDVASGSGRQHDSVSATPHNDVAGDRRSD